MPARAPAAPSAAALSAAPHSPPRSRPRRRHRRRPPRPRRPRGCTRPRRDSAQRSPRRPSTHAGGAGGAAAPSSGGVVDARATTATTATTATPVLNRAAGVDAHSRQGERCSPTGGAAPPSSGVPEARPRPGSRCRACRLLSRAAAPPLRSLRGRGGSERRGGDGRLARQGRGAEGGAQGACSAHRSSPSRGMTLSDSRVHRLAHHDPSLRLDASLSLSVHTHTSASMYERQERMPMAMASRKMAWGAASPSCAVRSCAIVDSRGARICRHSCIFNEHRESHPGAAQQLTLESLGAQSAARWRAGAATIAPRARGRRAYELSPSERQHATSSFTLPPLAPLPPAILVARETLCLPSLLRFSARSTRTLGCSGREHICRGRRRETSVRA